MIVNVSTIGSLFSTASANRENLVFFHCLLDGTRFTVYKLKKAVLRLRRKGKGVREICEVTGLADKTVRMTFAAYDTGGIDAIKPQKRGRKAGEKRTLRPEQEQDITSMLVDHDPEQLKLKGCMWTRGSIRIHPNKVRDNYAHAGSCISSRFY